MKTSRILACALAAFALLGCAGPDRGYVQREWSMTLRELGISPIFPPREDVVVGDVYLSTYDPNSEAIRRIFESKWNDLTKEEQNLRLSIGVTSRLTRLSKQLEDSVSKEYASTISAPATMGIYDSILGNPALAAATEAVAAAEEKLKKLTNIVKQARDEAQNARTAVTKATQENEDQETLVTSAETDLTEAKKTIKQDVTSEEGRLAKAKSDLLLKEDALAEKDHAVAKAAPDTAAHKQAQAEQRDAKYDKDRATVEVQRAQAALDEAKAKPVDVSSFESAVASEKKKKKDSAEKLLKAQRALNEKEAAATRIAEEQSAPIAKVTAEISALKVIQDNVGKAGAKMLYPQPMSARQNVYTGSTLPEGNGQGDALNSRVNRLRLVAFPEFASTTFTQGDLSALIPIEAMLIGLNVASSSVTKISVKVPAAESYALSLDHAIAKLTKSKAKPKPDETPWELSSELNAAVSAARVLANFKHPSSSSKRHIVYLTVITEVFYARALDISLFSASSFGARLQSSPLASDANPASTAEASSSMPPTTPVDAYAANSSTATSMLKNIQDRISTTHSVPGGSIQLVSYNDQAVGLRRVFDRPVAIGTRGFVITYELNNDQILDIAPDAGTTTKMVVE